LTSDTNGVLTSHDQVICTLFEGHYHIGFAVLLNSILRGGFQGLVYAGYRGELPPWTSQLQKICEGAFALPNGAQLVFEKLNPGVHFANYKPDFMLDLVKRGIATRLLWYFDPDITVRCSWNFFTHWAEYGIALCSEIINGDMPPRHPLRCMWVEMMEKYGWGEPVVPQTHYFNSGFLGLNVRYATFLDRWKKATAIAVVETNIDVTTFMPGTRENAFYAFDQDTLNLTTMYASEPISAIGPEGMGFTVGGFTMYHSVGGPKPWKKEFLRKALAGMPPSNGDKHFLECATGPIRPFTESELKAKLRTAKLGSMIGRFYRRM